MSEQTVEQYLVSKGLEYRYSGDQLQLTCPACGSPDKFYIDSERFLFQCKSGSCSWSGNEYKFKAHFGDSTARRSQTTTTQQQPRQALPDMEAAHSALLADDDVLNYLNDERGISLEVVQKMKLGVGNKWFDEEQGEVKCLMYPYYLGKNLVFVKYRNLTPGHTHDQRFRSTGNLENPLYNQNVVKNQMESLICVEGEMDCLSLIGAGVENVVGVPGADFKKVTWDKMMDRPQKLYIVYDNDAKGQAGAKNFAQRFGVEKFYNVILPSLELAEPKDGRTHTKDINEWLMAGGTVDDLRELLAGAERFDVDDVADTVGAIDELLKDIEERGTMEPEFKWFLPSINRLTGGSNRGRLSILLAPGKSGKTSLLINQADYLAKEEGHGVFLDCLEMTRPELARKWASMVTKTDDTPGRSLMTPEIMREAAKIAKTYPGKIQWGNTHTIRKAEDAFQRVRDTVRRYGSDVVMFDNLQALVDLTLTRFDMGNRVTYISMLAKQFKQLARELNVWIILISQPKRIFATELVKSSDTEGSSAPEKDCDDMVILNRFLKADMKRADMEQMGAGFSVDESFTPTVNVNVGLSRYGPGGRCNIHFEGCMSWFREISNTELEGLAPTPLLGPGEGIGTAVAI